MAYTQKFLLNPGDFQDVVTFDDQDVALVHLVTAREKDPLATLFRTRKRGRKIGIDAFDPRVNKWFPEDRSFSNVPNKVWMFVETIAQNDDGSYT